MSEKKKVRICIVHPRIKDAEGLAEKLLLDDVSRLAYEFVWDERNPQYVVATELIYTDPLMRKKFETLCTDDVVTIFMPGESMMPDLNLFDYGFSFDDLGGNDRLCTYPLRKFYNDYMGKQENELENSPDLAQRELNAKTGFCNFIYSNGSGHANRDKIFRTLEAYKGVDSLGAYRNNTGFSDSHIPRIEDRVRRSVAIKSRYKFTIAFENATQKGYTSEKIFTSLEAHSIPIYWGNPDIGKIVNEKAIINCHQYSGFEEVLERVKEIDSDDCLWCEMVRQPWLTMEQKESEEKTKEKYYAFWNRIFMEDFTRCGKRGKGTFPQIYKTDFFNQAKALNKSSQNYSLTLRWIRMLHKKRTLDLFLQGKKYRNIAIYGMGELGILVYEELQNNVRIENLYGIDKGNPKLPISIKCFRPYEVKEEMHPDLVIVTILWDFDNISYGLKKDFKAEIFSIEEIINKIEQEIC